ncbi:MAG TPA: hypothetical protein VGI45_10635 [Terracidiphilus sp.]|jgi:uncharacterized membrane protein
MIFCEICGTTLPESGAACATCASRAAGNAAAAAVPDATNSGLQPNAAAALAYAVGLITGILFLVIDPYKNDKYVRFHAYQSILFNVAWVGLWIVWMIAGLVLGAVTKGLFFLLELPANLLLALGGFMLWILLMYRAYQGRYFSLPFIGTIAANKADA